MKGRLANGTTLRMLAQRSVLVTLHSSYLSPRACAAEISGIFLTPTSLPDRARWPLLPGQSQAQVERNSAGVFGKDDATEFREVFEAAREKQCGDDGDGQPDADFPGLHGWSALTILSDYRP